MKNPTSKSSVSFFPVPLPDELLDSVVYRYHHLSGAPNLTTTIETLFGKGVSVVPKLITNHVEILWERAARKLFANADDLINGLTLLPALGAVFDRGQMKTARESSYHEFNLGMGSMYRTPIHVIQPEMQSCPMCVNEEHEHLGIAYWHRSHQLDGVAVCHRHGCDLQSVCRHCQHPVRRPRSMDLPQMRCPSCKKPQLAVFSHPEPVKKLAILANQALQGAVPFCDRRLLATKVRELVGGKTAEASERARNRYGAKYVNSLPDCFYSLHGDWLGYGLRFRSTVNGPEHGLLNLSSLGHMTVLVDSLFGSWEAAIGKGKAKALAA